MARKSKYRTTHNLSVDSLLRDYSDVESLKDELESWKDGMEGTNLENSQKFSDLDEACSALEAAFDKFEEATGELGDMVKLEGYAEKVKPILEKTVPFIVDTHPRKSRSDRNDEVMRSIRAGVDELSTLVETLEGKDEMELHDAVQQIIDDFEEGLGELENVSFPGMY